MSWRGGRSVKSRPVKKSRKRERLTRPIVRASNLTPTSVTLSQQSGYRLWDDFEVPSAETGEVGRLGWVIADIGSGGGSVAAVSPSASGWLDCGMIKLTTAGSSGNGIAIHQGQTTTCPFYGPPPVGARLFIKIKLDGTLTQVNIWAGLFYSATVIPDAAGSNTAHGIGFAARATATAVNWFGVCRKGTAETKVDLKVAANTKYATLGWRRTRSGIQFQVENKDVGPVVTTNIPASTQALAPVIAIAPASASARNIIVDYYGLTAPVKRFG
tara:strand:- start:844 stop:1656 length:813 start_codon:yes stop_codon:yes gene_type:complete